MAGVHAECLWLGLLNLEEWQKSEYAAQWDSPAERRGRKTDLSTGGYLDE